VKTFSNAAFRLRFDATEKSSLRFEPGGSRFASSVMYGTLHETVLNVSQLTHCHLGRQTTIW